MSYSGVFCDVAASTIVIIIIAVAVVVFVLFVVACILVSFYRRMKSRHARAELNPYVRDPTSPTTSM